MVHLDFHPSGRHFLQIPGPSPVPDRILRAMSYPTIDHRGPEFGALGLKVLAGIKRIFQTEHPVIIYPASGTGAWEAALTNTLSAGDRVLMFETGHFATLWKKMAAALGLEPESLSLPDLEGWRRGVQADMIEARLRQDAAHSIKAVCVRAQRDLDGGHLRHCLGSSCHRRGTTSGTVVGRHDFRAGLGRLSPRRMGC